MGEGAVELSALDRSGRKGWSGLVDFLVPVQSDRREQFRRLLGLAAPTVISANFCPRDDQQVFVALAEFLRNDLGITGDQGTRHFLARRRINKARNQIVPWLAQTIDFSGLKILEIGCGSGSNCVAYAEQGAIVTGADIDGIAIQVARERAKQYGVECTFLEANAAVIDTVVDVGEFDLVMYYASLEHMTLPEREATMSKTWSQIKPGAIWGLVETPNRLWPRDNHTSWLPFFHWLPDDLAVPYLKYSSKERLQKLSAEGSTEKLYRSGRGISFHEFDLFMQPVETMNVLSSLHSKQWFRGNRRDKRFGKLLHSMRPDVHAGFFQQPLDLLIRK